MHYTAMDDIEVIADELAEEFCGKKLSEIRREFRECGLHTSEFQMACHQLHDLFRLASCERYKRMGIEVKPGNMKRREPGEEG